MSDPPAGGRHRVPPPSLRRWDPTWRPGFIATLLVALVLIAFPDTEPGGPQITTAPIAGDAAGRLPSSTPDGAMLPSPTTAPATPAAAAAAPRRSTKPPPAGGPVRSAGETAGRPAAAAAGTPAATTYPGVGTAEALTNPDCDAATGRVRLPTPFAPECVRPWPPGGDNGGSTSQGVTGAAIRIAIYTSGNSGAQQQWRDTFEVFGAHYELWGRRVELVFVAPSGSDEVAQRADAIRVATEIKPFLSTTGPTIALTYSTELAARGVITFDFQAPWEHTQVQQPFRWAANGDERNAIFHITEYVGKRLRGRPVRWAGSAALNDRQRVFGLVYPETWERKVFDEQAARYGIRIADASSYDSNDAAGHQERARTQVTRMKAAGVTSVIAASDYLYTVFLTREATSQLWFPEWVMTGWGLQDTALFGRTFDPQQWRHAFGLSAINTLVPPDQYDTRAVYRWHHGHAPADGGTNGSAWAVGYQLFWGFHLAGPLLTPATFRDAMFAKAPVGGVWCDCRTRIGVSFGRHRAPTISWPDYTAWDDYREVWWNPDETGPDEAGLVTAPGMYMAIDGGARYNPGGWPTTEPRAFDPDGAVDLYDDFPRREAPPRYEHRPH